METGSDLDFGKMLGGLRGRKVSQGALALRAGTSQSYISRVEAGTVQPTLAQAQRLLHALGYEMRVEAKPMRVRSDPSGRPAQLVMTAEERMESAAAMGNLVAEMREGA